MVRYNNFCTLFCFIDGNCQNFGRAQSSSDEFLRIFAPVDNVNLFAAQFVYDHVYAVAVLTNTCAQSVHIFVFGVNSDFCSAACFSGNTLDFYSTVMYFRHFLFKETFYQFGMCSGNINLRALWCLFYFQHIYFDAIHEIILFAGNLFVGSQHRINFAHLYDDVSSFFSLYDSGHYFTFFCDVLIIEDFSFRFSEFLHNYLFCCLCSHTAEVSGCYFQIYSIANLIAGVQNSCSHQVDFVLFVHDFFHNFTLCVAGNVTCFSVDNNFDVLVGTKVLFASGNQRCFNGFKNDLLVDTFFFFNQMQCFDKFCSIHFSYSSLILRK